MKNSHTKNKPIFKFTSEMVPQFVFAEIRIHASYASHEEAILTIVYVVA
jgi:hypothetical protein